MAGDDASGLPIDPDVALGSDERATGAWPPPPDETGRTAEDRPGEGPTPARPRPDSSPHAAQPRAESSPVAPPGQDRRGLPAGGPRRRREFAVLAGVAGGGVVGAVARAGVLLAFPTRSGGFPWSTLLVNVSGSLLLGFLLVVLLERFARRRLARAVLGTGVIGAYTTFSTFMVESLQLIRGGALAAAAAYLALTLAGGLGATILGMVVARGLLGLAHANRGRR